MNRNYQYILFTIFFTVLLVNSCAYYSFTGKSIPPHIKTVQIMLFEDRTDRYDLNLSVVIKEKILDYVEDYKLMDEDDSRDSDSKIFGSIIEYKEGINSQINEDTADEREMKLSLSLNFYDNTKKLFIISKSKISDSQQYNESDGELGKMEAFDKLIDRICEQAVIKLSSNW